MKKQLKITSDGALVASLILAALLFRIFLMKYRFAVLFDEVNYLKLAASGSLEGLKNVFHTYWSPFYPFVVAMFSKVVPDFELSGRLVSIFSGGLIVLPIYYFAKKYFSRRIAILTAVFIAFLPSYAFMATNAQTEALYTLIAISGVFLGWEILAKPSMLKSIALGVLFGCSYLIKPEGTGFLIVFLGIWIILIVYQVMKKVKPWNLIFSGSLVIMFFLLVALPYLVFLHEATGKWTISAKGKANQQFEAVATGLTGKSFSTFRSLSDDNKHVLIDQIYHIGTFLKEESKKSTSSVSVNPGILIRKYVENFYKVIAFGMNHAITSVILILMILGLFGKPWDKKRIYRDLYLLCYVFFFWFIVIPLFHINDRYFMSVFPIVLIWASEGFFYLISWFEKTLENIKFNSFARMTPRSMAIVFTTGVILIGVFLPQLGKVITRNPWKKDYFMDPIEQRIAGEWIKKQGKKNPIIMSRGHTVDFYAGNYHIQETVTIPKNELERILAYAKYRNVDYLVLNERYAKDFPQIAYLLDAKDVPASLKLVYSNEFKPGLKTVIYQLTNK